LEIFNSQNVLDSIKEKKGVFPPFIAALLAVENGEAKIDFTTTYFQEVLLTFHWTPVCS